VNDQRPTLIGRLTCVTPRPWLGTWRDHNLCMEPDYYLGAQTQTFFSSATQTVGRNCSERVSHFIWDPLSWRAENANAQLQKFKTSLYKHYYKQQLKVGSHHCNHLHTVLEQFDLGEECWYKFYFSVLQCMYLIEFLEEHITRDNHCGLFSSETWYVNLVCDIPLYLVTY